MKQIKGQETELKRLRRITFLLEVSSDEQHDMIELYVNLFRVMPENSDPAIFCYILLSSSANA